jgi:hypothetical protein
VIAAEGGPRPLEELRNRFSISLLALIATRLLGDLGMAPPPSARLFQMADVEADISDASEITGALEHAIDALLGSMRATPESVPDLLGAAFEGLLSLEIGGAPGARHLSSSRRRRRTGSFFTPSTITALVLERALQMLTAVGRSPASDIAVCDPACGAGAFLIAAARALVEARRRDALEARVPFDEIAARRRVAQHCIAGVDLDPLAVAITELSLWAFVGDPTFPPEALVRLHQGDAVTGRGFSDRGVLTADRYRFDWDAAFPGERERGFDLVVGNPPWIAYAGRATQPLAPARRAFFAQSYRAFRGYPTLHAVFVERAAELCPSGIVALVIPSPLADLDGYRPARRALASSHAVCEPMLEFGQDAFEEVTQPCFALIARPRSGPAVDAELGRPFRLSERARCGVPARALEVPEALSRFGDVTPLPHELFREMGFQTTRSVSQALLKRGERADAEHSYPLLEGREVSEFKVGPPRLFLRPDLEFLARARCRLRAREEYRTVRFVVRQTAKVPIAALHSGEPFRNTLLAGFETEEFPASLLVGLLNSSLYRALHVSRQRDARQAVFPQVKIAHLRALPRPPSLRTERAARVRALANLASQTGLSKELRRELDSAVFDLFDFSVSEREQTLAFLVQRAPELVP